MPFTSRKAVASLFLLLLCYSFTIAQHTSIRFSVEGDSTVKKIKLLSTSLKESYTHANTGWFWETSVSIKDGRGQWKPKLGEPVFLLTDIPGYPETLLFVSPGDSLELSIRSNVTGKRISITGSGSHNNQPLSLTGRFDRDKYKPDTLPHRLVKDLRENYLKDSASLEQYIKQYHPSDAYISAQRNELQYGVLEKYYSFFGNHKFQLRRRPDYEALRLPWIAALDSMMRRLPINNEQALVAPSYPFLLRTFLSRTKEDLWEYASKQPGVFFTEWYGDSARGAQSYSSDMENLLIEKIIQRHLSGKVAAFAYAHLLHSSLGEKEDNLPAIYNRLEQQYPGNAYLPYLAPSIATIREKEKRVLNDKMLFVSQGDTLRSFSQLQQLTKGKTVLLDMWGTWCSPCRQEIDKNALALKQHFKGKDLTFLYVANYDIRKDSIWRKLVAYYGMEGMHILASQQLTDDIMNTTGAKGFPSYIILKKDGNFELSKAGYPMKREKLIEQLEKAL